MKFYSTAVLLVILIVISNTLCLAQNKNLSMEDVVLSAKRGLVPEKLEQLQWRAKSSEFVFVDKKSSPEKLKSSTPGETTYKDIVSVSTINKKLKVLGIDTTSSFPVIKWNGQDQFTFEASGHVIEYNLKTETLNKLLEAPSKVAQNKDYHSEAKIIAYTVENNLWINTNKERKQVTFDSIADIVNGQIVHREEFGIHKGTYFSPKGNFLAFYRMDQRMVTNYPVLDLNKQPAGVTMVKYPMAGGISHHVTIGIYNIQSGKTIFLKTGEPAEQYLTNIAWSTDENKIYVAILNREQNHLKMNRYDVQTGNFEITLFEEKEEKYIQPLNPIMFNNSGTEFIWQSRRDGYNHLYLYDKNGKLIKQVTKGKWEVAEFLGFDSNDKSVFYSGNEVKPINKDVYTTDLKSGKTVRLSSGEGVHKSIVNNSGEFIIDEYSGPGIPRHISIKNKAGKNLNTLLNAPDPLKDFTPVKREIFTLKNENGDELYCRMIKPATFDSTRIYPVIVYVYGGPGIQLVTNNWQGGGDMWANYMAQRGIIIFTIENRGTPMRGKDFEQSTFRKLGDVEMEDQVTGAKFLMTKKYIDKSRMGIYGWSYGGFMTTSMMTRHPNIFRAGVAGGPVIDWRYYEIMYTERYMDTPQENPEGYEKSNLLNYVDKLKGKLLLIHGTADDVVVWQHSLLYLKKAVDKNVQVDYFVYPGHEHNVTGRDRVHLLNKISQYFFENFN